jgi:K+-sensing histidine kinase KdpD
MLGVRARRMGLLLDFSQSLSQQRTLDGMVQAGLEYVSRYFEAEVVAFLQDPTGGLERQPRCLFARGIHREDAEREYPACGRETG